MLKLFMKSNAGVNVTKLIFAVAVAKCFGIFVLVSLAGRRLLVLRIKNLLKTTTPAYFSTASVRKKKVIRLPRAAFSF